MYLWIVATVVAFFIKGLCGFANTLIFTSMLSFGTNNIAISPVELLLGYPSNMILTWKHRKELNRRVYILLSLLVIAGCIPGALLLKKIEASSIKIVFGVLVVGLGIEMYLRETKQIYFKGSKILLGIIGIMSGIFCGLFGVGALLTAYVGRVAGTSSEFKANISAVFIVENTFRVILYSLMGIITLSTLKQAIIMLPFMLIGLLAGIKCGDVLDERMVRRIVIILLIVSGSALIIGNLC